MPTTLKGKIYILFTLPIIKKMTAKEWTIKLFDSEMIIFGLHWKEINPYGQKL